VRSWGDTVWRACQSLPGDPIVSLHHLKQPAAEVGPFKIHHDHDSGHSTIWRAIDLVELVRATGGISVIDVARALFDSLNQQTHRKKRPDAGSTRWSRPGTCGYSTRAIQDQIGRRFGHHDPHAPPHGTFSSVDPYVPPQGPRAAQRTPTQTPMTSTARDPHAHGGM
jgi:hypothetical protein